MSRAGEEPRTLFGTDGIRGIANQEPMTAETAMKVGAAAGSLFVRGDHRHRVVIGKDTRLSGYLFEPALTAGFVSVGMDVILVGPMPTPAVAMLTRALRADLGVMISASHNLFADNGIKLFGPDGYKLSDETEARIEAAVETGTHGLAAPGALGRARRLEDAEGRYIEFAKTSFPQPLGLEGRRIVIDCAHGAAYKVAPTVLWELGAEVITIGAEPDGFNINKGCGSTDTALLARTVVERNADIGIALDGDADRVVMCDENGAVIDGDHIMALIASSWADGGRLEGGGVVATVMSNLGLERYLAGIGLVLARTRVGDRYVVEHMRAHGFNLGGEQSGHIVMSDHATTGDGLLAALQTLAALAATGRRASDMTRLFEPLPQVLRNVRVADTGALESAGTKAAIAEGHARLGKHGRLLVRASGTEPVIRVMAEGDDEALVSAVVDDVAEAVVTAAEADDPEERTSAAAQ
ncbi:MAG: phosphoglucosamine mutase [Rhodospirillales bacterium]|nr:phosphoglucosamine mutase [Rhodospirillales bacterium]